MMKEALPAPMEDDLAWTASRARAMDQLAGADGIFVGAAMDHRDSMRSALATHGLEIDDAGLTELKLRVARVLAPAATLVLLDAEYSVAQAIAAGVVPGATGLAIALEAQGYGSVGEATATTFLAGWSPAKTAELGGSGCKLLLPFRVDARTQAAAQEQVVIQAIRACHAAGVALILEPIAYPDPADSPARLSDIIVSGARRLAKLGPDILKVQYPGSLKACEAMDEACGPEVPWALLGGGAGAEQVTEQIEQACTAGASGFVVGRTLFQPGLVRDPEESERRLREESIPLLEEWTAAARRSGRPWRDRVGVIPAPQLGWYRH